MPMTNSTNSNRPRRGRLGAVFLVLCAGAALAGCNRTSPMHTGSITKPTTMAQLNEMGPDELAKVVRAYGASYERNPADKGVGLAYASTLQMTGRNDQSLSVMQQVAIAHPQDRDVLSAYGKALAAAGDLEKALETVRRAQTPDHPDWRLLSAEGAILDQLGQTQPARVLYRKALEIEPGEPSILSNLAMSQLLANDLKGAEGTLRQAIGHPAADARVRQNLALVVGLQGRFDEAETIARSDMSPEDASANVAYLRQMLAQTNTWSELEREERS